MSTVNQKSCVLVTGAALRIGREIALNFAKKGFDVAIHYNNSKDVALKLQNEIKDEFGVKCECFVADLSDGKREVGYGLIDEVTGVFDNLCLLVNNASTFKTSDLKTLSEEEFDRDINIHLKNPLFLAQSFAKHCQKNNIGGNVVNIIDKNIVRYETRYFSYLLSKKMLGEFTKMAAVQLAPQVRVNAVCPGFIIAQADDANPEEYTKKTVAKIPVRRKGCEQDIVSAVNFLYENEFVNGDLLFVDGGAALNHAG